MKLLVTFLISLSLFAQANPNNVTLNASGPSAMPANAISVSITGTPGSLVRSIWIVTNYPIGSTSVSGPYTYTNEPNPLSVSNYITISWPCQSGALSYDILKTKPGEPTPLPGNTYIYAISTGVTTCSVTDQTTTRLSYTVPVPVATAVGQILLDNLDLTYPYFKFTLPVTIPSGSSGIVSSVIGTTSQICTSTTGTVTTFSLCNPTTFPGSINVPNGSGTFGTTGTDGCLHLYDTSGTDTTLCSPNTANGDLTIASTEITLNGSTYAAGGGTHQAQTVTLSPAITSYAVGQQVFWLPVTDNTGAAPTLAINGLTAIPITKYGANALVADDIVATAIAYAIYDGTEFELQNPQTIPTSVACPTCVTSAAALASGSLVIGGGNQTTSASATYSNLALGVLTLGSTGVAGEVTLNGSTSGTASMTVSASGGTMRFAALTATGAVSFSSLTNSDAGDYVCINSSVLEYDATACLASLTKYKTSINPVSSSVALNEVLHLRPISYRYKTSFRPKDRWVHLGFTAEDVQKVDSRAAAYKYNGELEGVDYQRMSVLYAGAIQAMQAEIDQLRKDVADLKAKTK